MSQTSINNQSHIHHPSTDGSPRWEYLLLFIIPFGTIWGNVFVCLAVYLERRLRHRFNLFLVSLAISDLLCAILVMPVSAWHMIIGRNDRDLALCLVWYSLDIFFTATTIIHLCNISLDRYLALRKPFGSVRTRPHPLNSLTLRIILSWLISFSIAGPLFLFALKQQEQELEVKVVQLPTPVVVQLTHDPLSVDHLLDESADTTASYKGCGPNDPSFVLTAIGVTFVLPLIIMITTYVLTVQTLKQHMQQIQAIQLYATKKAHYRSGTVSRKESTNKPMIMMSEIMSDATTTRMTTYGNSHAINKSDGVQCNNANNGLRSNENGHTWHHDGETQITDAETFELVNHETVPTNNNNNNTDDNSTIPNDSNDMIDKPIHHNNDSSNSSETNDEDDEDEQQPSRMTVEKRNSKIHHNSEYQKPHRKESPSYQDSTYLTVNSASKPNRTIGRKSFRTGFRWSFKPNLNNPTPGGGGSSVIDRSVNNTTAGTTTQSDNRLTMDRIHKGKRAVRVIGVLFGVFITCYLPFFIVYIIDVLCPSCNPWTGPIMAHLEWLGYLSSMLNPFVYHSFNPTFRRTFRRMMRCTCCRKHRRHEHYAIWRRRIRL